MPPKPSPSEDGPGAAVSRLGCEATIGAAFAIEQRLEIPADGLPIQNRG